MYGPEEIHDHSLSLFLNQSTRPRGRYHHSRFYGYRALTRRSRHFTFSSQSKHDNVVVASAFTGDEGSALSWTTVARDHLFRSPRPLQPQPGGNPPRGTENLVKHRVRSMRLSRVVSIPTHFSSNILFRFLFILTKPHSRIRFSLLMRCWVRHRESKMMEARMRWLTGWCWRGTKNYH